MTAWHIYGVPPGGVFTNVKKAITAYVDQMQAAAPPSAPDGKRTGKPDVVPTSGAGAQLDPATGQSPSTPDTSQATTDASQATTGAPASPASSPVTLPSAALPQDGAAQDGASAQE